MALPNQNSSLEELFDEFLFTGAYLSNTKGMTAHGKKVLDARKKLQTAVDSRNEVRDAWMLSHVAAVIAWDGMKVPLESFDRQVDAHFDDDRKGYRAVFADTVAVILRTPVSAREAHMKPVLDYAKKAGHSGKLASSGKDLVHASTEYLARNRDETAASAELDKAVAAVTEAKRRAVVVMREADGALRGMYAETPALAKKFFRQKPAKKATPAASTTPADPPADPVPTSLPGKSVEVKSTVSG